MKINPILFILHALLPSAIQSAMMIKGGTYALTEVFDANDEPVQLPVGRFDLHLASAEEGGDASTTTTRYRLNLKIGNMLGGSFEMSSSDNVQTFQKMGPMRSTMMMPPQELYALENRLNKLFPAVTEIDVEDTTITFKGSEGSAAFKEVVE